MQLHDFQIKSISDTFDALRIHNRVVLQSPTGSGKTVIAGHIVKLGVDNGRKILFICPRRELVEQTVASLGKFGVPSGVVMAGVTPSFGYPVQVASCDTLHARAMRSNKMELPPADLVIFDEAHLSLSKSRSDIIKLYPNSKVIGLTATPARGDGRSLGELYDHLVIGESIKSLVERNFLVPLKYYVPSTPDLSNLKVRMGDYVESQLDDLMNKPKLIGDILEHWTRLASDRPTVVFCSGVAHSRNVAEAFCSIGVRAEHLDGETPADERKDILDRVRSGETQVLCNVFVASYGLDIPKLSCCVLARPTKNITLYLQTVGRVMRTFDGKKDAIVIDHSGAVAINGFAEDDQLWSIEKDTTVYERKEKAKREKGEPKQITCPSCTCQFVGRRDCPVCGMQVIPMSKPVPFVQATLVEAKSQKSKEHTQEEKELFYQGLITHAHYKGYSVGWAFHQYKKRFHCQPSNKFCREPLAEVPVQVQAFIRQQNIIYAKSRQKANGGYR